MPTLTVANVLASARDKLGDNTAVAAGRVVSDSELLGFLQSAFLELHQITRNIVTAYFARRELYTHVTPNQGWIPIDAFGVFTDVSTIEEVWERKLTSWVGISNVTAATNSSIIVFTTIDPHGRQVGDQIQIVNSVFNWANGLFTVALVGGPDSLTVTGRPLTAGGAETNPGRMLFSTGSWNRVGIGTRHLNVDLPIDTIPVVVLEDGGIRINPVNNDRVLKISALMGIDTIPVSTDILTYPESQEYLALKTALIAHIAKGGNPERISALTTMLYGPGGDPANLRGGAAQLLVRSLVLQGQQVRYIRPRFRPPRQVSMPVYVKF